MRFLPLAVALALSYGQAHAQGAGANTEGDYIVSSVGLGTGGFAAISDEGAPGDVRLYLYTGSKPASAGSVMFYMPTQPAKQHPFIQLTMQVTAIQYLGTYTQGGWPVPTMLVADYEFPEPLLCANWFSSFPLSPHTSYSINVHVEPRPINAMKNGAPPPQQGSGVGVIQ